MGSSLTFSYQLGRRLFLYGLYKHCSIRPKNNRERTTHHRWRGPPPYSDKVETGMIGFANICFVILRKGNYNLITVSEFCTSQVIIGS